jgi:peptide-methionine (S)-S-oxide reductase
MGMLEHKERSMSDKQVLVLGGGCFWCTEAVYKEVRGVTDVESGYSNGHVKQPTYEQVCTGTTGHNEVVRLEYDPALISTREVLEIFFVVHDPTTLNRQGNDVGTQYRSGIYFTTPEQEAEARAIVAELNRDNAFGRPVVTEITALDNYSARRGLPPGFLRAQPAPGLLHGGGRAQGGQVPQDVLAAGEVGRRPGAQRPGRQRGQNTITASPPSTSAQAPSFQPGMASPRLSAEALMPNTGTSSAIGVTVAAGWRASSQFQAP